MPTPESASPSPRRRPPGCSGSLDPCRPELRQSRRTAASRKRRRERLEPLGAGGRTGHGRHRGRHDDGAGRGGQLSPDRRHFPAANRRPRRRGTGKCGHGRRSRSAALRALAYLDLLRAFEQKAIAEETLCNAQQLAQLTADFARTGQGSRADADRAETELAVRRNDVLRADESTRVASAHLAELLNLDATQVLVPQEPGIVPLGLVPPEIPLRQLVTQGMSNRPELAESRELVCAAVQRLEREQFAPLVPSVLLGVSCGGFGGGRGRYDCQLSRTFRFRCHRLLGIAKPRLGRRGRAESGACRVGAGQVWPGAADGSSCPGSGRGPRPGRIEAEPDRALPRRGSRQRSPRTN